MTKLISSMGVLLAMWGMQPTDSLGQTPTPFICMYGHSDDTGVTAAFRKLIPRITVVEGTSTDVAFLKELSDADGVVIADRGIDRADRGTQWNEWSRVIFTFEPSTPSVHIELHDAKASPGTVLYWDFVELEATWTVD